MEGCRWGIRNASSHAIGTDQTAVKRHNWDCAAVRRWMGTMVAAIRRTNGMLCPVEWEANWNARAFSVDPS